MGQIKVEKNAGGIEGLCVIEPAVHGDARGYFMETYNQRDMEAEGLTMNFVQDNQSCSVKGVLRGLHFQKEFPQGKLVRVIKGSVYDVAVDLRSGSRTFGKWFGRSSSIFRRALLTASWCSAIWLSSAINVQTSTILETRAGLRGTTLKSESSGRSFWVSIRGMLRQKGISWRMERN